MKKLYNPFLFIFFTFLACNCHGHSTDCKYDEEVNRKGLSLDIHGHYDGGGVCQNCQHNTVGINCNKCKPKYYRPKGKHWNKSHPVRLDELPLRNTKRTVKKVTSR